MQKITTKSSKSGKAKATKINMSLLTEVQKRRNRIGLQGLRAEHKGEQFVIDSTDWSKAKRLMVYPQTAETIESDKRADRQLRMVECGTCGLMIYSGADIEAKPRGVGVVGYDASEVVLIDKWK